MKRASLQTTQEKPSPLSQGPAPVSPLVALSATPGQRESYEHHAGLAPYTPLPLSPSFSSASACGTLGGPAGKGLVMNQIKEYAGVFYVAPLPKRYSLEGPVSLTVKRSSCSLNYLPLYLISLHIK